MRLHLSPKSSLLRREDLTGKPAVLFSQASSRPERGCSWLFNAIELRLFYATELRLFNAIELRVFYARCAIVYAPWARGRKGEGSDDWLLMNDYCLLMKKMGKSLVEWEIIRIFAA